MGKHSDTGYSPSVQPRLIVYIPSFGNFAGALSQVKTLALQGREARSVPWSKVEIVVSVNGCEYDRGALEAWGARVIQRPTNLGGDANIALGFVEATVADFLWILSDNDPVQPEALATIASALANEQAPDIVVGVSDSLLEGSRRLDSPVTTYGGAFHIGLISAVVYRWSSFVQSTPAALQALWTGWAQIALQEHAVKTRNQTTAACVPLSQIVQLTRGDQSDDSVNRARQSYSHSFYGGALLGFLSAEIAEEDGRKEVSRWWRHHWLYASAYRPRRSWPHRNFRFTLVEGLIRTGSLGDRTLWIASLLPYWRLGLWLRRRGFTLRRWT